MITYDRDFKGIWISKNVWLDNRLNALEKVILMEIDSLDSGEKGCYASNKYIAEFCHCSESKVSKAITKLIKLGYVKIHSFDGRQRGLKSTFRKADSQNMPESNIDNNIENNIDSNIYSGSAKRTTSPPRHKYGTYKNVLLSDEDMEKLKTEFPTDWEQRIERVSEYVASTGKTYKNYLATIRVWAKKDKERNGNNGQAGGITEQNIGTTYKGGKWL